MNTNQYKSVLSALQTFVDPSSTVELRALGVNGDETHSGCFLGSDLPAMAKAALELDGKSRGVYFTPNPLNGPINNQPIGQVKRRSGGETAKDSDVSVRRWLLIDADPTRISDDGEILDTSLPATDAENEQAYRMIEHVRAIMEGTFGFLGQVVASSGNGWHVCYPVDMPNDEVSKGMHRDLLKGLDKRCSNSYATIDTKTFNAARIWKVYATKSRKGKESENRSYRWAGMLDGEKFNPDHRSHNTERLKAMLKRWQAQDELEARESAPQLPSSQGEITAYTKKALDSEVAAVQSAGPGNRNNALNESAFKLGTMVGAGLLTRDVVEQSLMAAGVSAGLSESECKATIRSGIEGGIKSPREVKEQAPKPTKTSKEVKQETKSVYAEAGLGNYGTSESATEKRPLPASMEDIAGIRDLVKAGAKLRWLWKGWIQIGVVNILAAQGGCGKTRLALDIVRRIKHGYPWPDGQPMEVDPASLSLWVLSDNNHDEIVTAAQSFGIEDSIKLNAHPEDPYGGVLLSGMDDLCELEARIKIVKPALVFIDTVGNATDLNLSKQEDAKAFYQPLQVIARRHSVAIMCLTHLNANGGTLGRRANEKVRSVINMSKPDPDQENRRRLWVAKSNSQIPPPLGVTMGDTGNEYDDKPPTEPEDADGRPVSSGTRSNSKMSQCVEWLKEKLDDCSIPIAGTIAEAEEKEFAKQVVYRAIERLGAETFEIGGRKFWRLIPENAATE